MIRSVKGGHRVYSESGKPLSKVYKTKAEAQKRLNQIHYYSNKKGK